MADNRRGSPSGNRPRKQAPQAQRPFDVWLNRQLHAMYDDIAREPLPQDVVELIERDGSKRATDAVSDDTSHQQASPDEAIRRDKR